MPIKIPNNLPATNILESENIFVIHENRAYTQDIRPLKILILNLMPQEKAKPMHKMSLAFRFLISNYIIVLDVRLNKSIFNDTNDNFYLNITIFYYQYEYLSKFI